MRVILLPHQSLSGDNTIFIAHFLHKQILFAQEWSIIKTSTQTAELIFKSCFLHLPYQFLKAELKGSWCELLATKQRKTKIWIEHNLTEQKLMTYVSGDTNAYDDITFKVTCMRSSLVGFLHMFVYCFPISHDFSCLICQIWSSKNYKTFICYFFMMWPRLWLDCLLVQNMHLTNLHKIVIQFNGSTCIFQSFIIIYQHQESCWAISIICSYWRGQL